MKIIVNGESHSVTNHCTAQALITHLQLQDQRIAMEVNREIVPRSQYDDFRLSADDRIEIVKAIGGG